jgi:dethiobiotin synthetase
MIRSVEGVFVTGTGTGVGKTVVAAALCAAAVAEGRTVMASKPLLSGLEEPAHPPWPHDHNLLARVTGARADEIAPHRYAPAVSPHLAARWAGDRLDVDLLTVEVMSRYASMGVGPNGELPELVVEGAGGLLVPIDDDGVTMADFALNLELPLVIVAPPGLGTINHLMLTIEAALARGLEIAGVVLSPWPKLPGPIEADNRAYLNAYAEVPVLALDTVRNPTVKALATAGAAAGLTALLD